MTPALRASSVNTPATATELTVRPRVGRAALALLIAATFLLGVAPMVRISLEATGQPIPLYVMDLLLVAMALTFCEPRRLPPRQRVLLAWGVAFVASTLPSVIVACVDFNEPLFTFYSWSRRVIALSAFATYLVIFTARPSLRRVTLAALAAGLLVTSVWCVAQVVTRSTGVVGALDSFYYDTLAKAVLESQISRWTAAWKTARAVGGWWNANSAGGALVLLLAAAPAMIQRPWVRATTALALVALLATASRQALLGIGVILVALMASADRASTRQRRVIVIAATIGILAALALAGDQLARVTGDVEGTWGESVSARWNNYPDAFRTLGESSPWRFVVGRGAESWTVAGRTGAQLDSAEFVSNAFMLTLLENGALAAIVLLGFFVVAFRTADAAWQRGIVVLVMWLMNCDNYLYLFPGVIAVMAVLLGLAASPPTVGRVVSVQPARAGAATPMRRRPAVGRATA